MTLKQIDCFNINMKFWTVIGIWPGRYNLKYYKYYSIIFVGTFIILYNSLFTINFYFVEKKLDSVIEEMIFYFTEVAATSKVFTYLLLHKEIVKMLEMLEDDIFQPVTQSGLKILEDAKKLNVMYWKIVAGVSVICNIAHVAHITQSASLDLPVCSYSFLSKNFRDKFNYLLYFYQSLGIHVTMWYNVNIDTFILGVMILAITQLDILDEKLRKITDREENFENETDIEHEESEYLYLSKFKDCIVQYDYVCQYCSLLQRIFSITLFVQFGMASYIICVCLFRFTLPAPIQYYIFLATYMTCMILQVMVPCWFGTQIIDKSFSLTKAVYACDWSKRSRKFKSNMRYFVSRASIPLSINGWKMFPLSLKTFTAIINSAYSVFALLRHMHARQ